MMLRTLVVMLALGLSGCSLFVKPTEELEFLTYSSERILACVQAKGGRCEAAVTSDRLPKVSAQQKAAFVRGLNLTSAVKANDATRFTPGATRARSLPERTPAAYAADVLKDPVGEKLEILFEHAAGLRTGSEPPALRHGELSRYAAAIQKASTFDSWSHLKAEIRSRKVGLAPADAAVAEAVERQLTLIEAYLGAYFNDGEFVSLDIDLKDTTKSAISQLMKKLSLSEADATALANNLVSQLAGQTPHDAKVYHLIVKKQGGGFVTRGGTPYVFPGVNVTIDPRASKVVKVGEIDFTQVGSEVVRAFVEALGDAWAQLPADSSSTACKLKTAGQLDTYPWLKCYVEKDDQLSADHFVKVNTVAGKVETYVATAAGQLLRGAGWVSLNNEALAKLIETAIGVVARKATEKVTWCYLACKSTAPPQEKPQPAVTTLPLRIAP